MKQAIVAIEDKRFYEHNGVDLHAIGRALLADVEHKSVVQGGSTITQQFIKNSYVADNRSIARKLKEAALAWQLEQRHRDDKDWILDRVPEHDLLRERRLRDRTGGADVLPEAGEQADAARGGSSRGSRGTRRCSTRSRTRRRAKERRASSSTRCSSRGSSRPTSTTRPAPRRCTRRPTRCGSRGRRRRRARYFVNYVKQQLISDPEYGPGPSSEAACASTRRSTLAPPEDGAHVDLEGADGSERAAGGARGDQAAAPVRSDGHGRRIELPRQPVQPRRAGRAASRAGLHSSFVLATALSEGISPL